MLGIKDSEHSGQPQDGWIGPAPSIDTPPPGPRARLLIDRDERCTSPSNTRDYPLVVRRAHGSVVEDVDGNRYLDFAAGIAVCATGHSHPKVVSAIQEQAASLIHICGTDFYYEPMVRLCEKLTAVTPGDFPKRVLLTNSGTEAVEAAIKMCRRHTHRKRIIAFYGAFHGRTMGALALTSSKATQKAGFGPLIPMVSHVPYGTLDALRDTIFKQQLDPSEVAAIFVEPIQGEGGYVFPDPSFLPELRALCDEHDIVMVCDEIQSGAGRTGKMYACEHYDVVPDVLLTAKGLASGMPLGAVVARETVMDWPPGAQGSTYGGNPVCCAAALATLDLIQSSYMNNAATLGPHLQRRLGVIAEKCKVFADVRGLGFMVAVDVVHRQGGKPDAAKRLRICKEAFTRGLILLPCGDHSIRFCPPLCINQTQLDVGLDVLDEAIATVTR